MNIFTMNNRNIRKGNKIRQKFATREIKSRITKNKTNKSQPKKGKRGRSKTKRHNNVCLPMLHYQSINNHTGNSLSKWAHFIGQRVLPVSARNLWDSVALVNSLVFSHLTHTLRTGKSTVFCCALVCFCFCFSGQLSLGINDGVWKVYARCFQFGPATSNSKLILYFIFTMLFLPVCD